MRTNEASRIGLSSLFYARFPSSFTFQTTHKMISRCSVTPHHFLERFLQGWFQSGADMHGSLACNLTLVWSWGCDYNKRASAVRCFSYRGWHTHTNSLPLIITQHPPYKSDTFNRWSSSSSCCNPFTSSKKSRKRPKCDHDKSN